MTLPDVTEDTTKVHEQKKMNIGKAVRDTITQAKYEGRVTSGVFECAKLLEVGSDNIMLCLIPAETNTNDVTIHIQHTLIEAFCWENEIRLLKVDSSTKLGALLADPNAQQNDNDIAAGRTKSDFSCILIKEPENCEFSQSDECVTDYYNHLMCSDVFPCPVITIPV